jgi:glucokinase
MNFSSKKKSYLSVEIGGTKLQLIIFSPEAEILGRWRFRIDKEKGASGIQHQIETCVRDIRKGYDIMETGVGFGGPVNPQTGIIGISHQISGWSGFGLSAWLSAITDSQVHIENDANVAALGEAVYGAGKDLRTVFYMTIGSGIGGGLVQNGQLYHGRAEGETEIGHLCMDVNGTTLEDECAGWAIDARVREAAGKSPESILATLVASNKPGAEAQYLSPAFRNGCQVAGDILENVVKQLSWGLSHVVHLFNPDVLILGGGISLIGTPLLNGIRDQLPGFVMGALKPIPKVELAALGEDVVPMGALALIISKNKGKLA